jgi:hypothetical protein
MTIYGPLYAIFWSAKASAGVLGALVGSQAEDAVHKEGGEWAVGLGHTTQKKG